MSDQHERLRTLPKIDDLMRRDDIASLSAPRWAVAVSLRGLVETRRQQILAGKEPLGGIAIEEVEEAIETQLRPELRRVINATGVVLHTNLGRAPLPEAAAARAVEIAAGYSNLEYDVALGRRGSRHGHLSTLLRQLTGAEDALVVNNNAGAVMLALAALSAGKECIVSRGELVEIGGSFRVPDVMELSGATLVEVGTTNKTRVADYAAAIGEQTGLLLQVHRSNFAIVGFTEDTPLVEIVALAKEHGLCSMIDLGSGALVDAQIFGEWGLPAEPSVAEVMDSGVDICTFSGDKLLGGPQAGIMVGNAKTIERLRRHPMMRALRPDKLTLAALCATLELYRDGDREQVPTVAMLSASVASLQQRAEKLKRDVGALGTLDLDVVACESAVGGGAMPLGRLPSVALALRGASANFLERRFRDAEPAIIGRIQDGRFLLDLRTLLGDEEQAFVATAVRRVDGELQ